MSASIRAKKKKMMEEHSDAVKLSGIPEDATDIEIIKGQEATDALNENHPKERDESPSLEELHAKTVAAQPHDEMAPNPKQINMEGHEEDEMRRKKLKASYMKAMMK